MKKICKRLLSTILVLVMVLGLVPMSSITANAVTTIGAGTVIYFKPFSEWETANAKMGFISSANGNNSSVILMTKAEGSDGIYKGVLEKDATNIQFLRLNPDVISYFYSEDESGGIWNRTEWSSLGNGTNLYTLNSDEKWTGATGVWSKYTEPSTPADESSLFYVNADLIDYYNDARIDTNNTVTLGSNNQGNLLEDRSKNGVAFSYLNGLTSNYYANSQESVPLYFGSLLYVKNRVGRTALASTDYSALNRWNSTANVALSVDGTTGNYDACVQGLVEDTLGANGELYRVGTNSELPFFSKTLAENWKIGSNVVMKYYDDYAFPFKVTQVEGTNMKKYSYDSTTDYGVAISADSKKMTTSTTSHTKNYDGTNGYFPFNMLGESNQANINYGFGTKFTIPFTIKENGTLDGTKDGQAITFEFTGDDDVWVFLDGKLILDMGGAHAKSQGTINFKELTATVADAATVTTDNKQMSGYASNGVASYQDKGLSNWVWDNNKERSTVATGKKTLSFSTYGEDFVNSFKDASQSHTLVMFYMERGMFDSNMKVEFTINPIASGLSLSKSLNMADVNDGLVDAMQKVENDNFNFKIETKDLKTGTEYEVVSNLGYTLNNYDNVDTSGYVANGSVVTGVGARSFAHSFINTDTGEDAFVGGTGFQITEQENSTTVFKYDITKTVWNVYDKNNHYNKIASGTGTVATFDMGSSESDGFDSYDYDVNFRNTPNVGAVSLTKKWISVAAAPSEKFDFRVEVDLDGVGKACDYSVFELDYTIGAASYTMGYDGIVPLAAGETAVISGLPADATVKVTETPSAGDGWAVNGESQKTVTVIQDQTANVTIENKAVATNDYLNVDKTVSKNGDDYTLTLEAYVKGNVEEMEVTKPTDIVLVIDRSASMRTPTGAPKVLTNSYIYNGVGQLSEAELDLEKGKKLGYYVAQSNATKNWFILQYNASNAIWTGYGVESTEYIVNTKYYDAKAAEEDGSWSQHFKTLTWSKGQIDDNLVFYKSQYAMLYDSILGFVEELQNSGVEHRVAITSFAGSKTQGTGIYTEFNNSSFVSYKAITSKRNDGLYTQLAEIYHSALRNVQNAEEYAALLNSIELIETNESFTCPAAGLDIANELYANNTIDSKERERMTILFTDGIPNKKIGGDETTTETSTDIFKEIVEKAYVTKKTHGAKVFCISTTTLGTEASRDFLRYASSDYPDLETYPTSGTLLDSTASQYTFEVGSDERMEIVFKSIATATTVKVKLDENAVLTEVLSNYFELPESITANLTQEQLKDIIKVYTASYQGNGNFSEPELFADALITVSSSQEGGRLDMICVTNFDYADNYVSDSPVAQGKKLIVQVPVEVRDGFWGGNNVPTNAKTTAVYEENVIVKRFPMPEVNVPIDVAITAEDRIIYYGGDIKSEDLFGSITVNGNEVDVIENEDGTFTFVPKESWMDDYAELVWSDGSTTTTSAIDNKEAKDYNYSVTLKPIYDGSDNLSFNPSNIVGDSVNSTGKQASDDAHVSILVPVVTFKDSTIVLGEQPTGEYYDANDFVKVEWVDSETRETGIATGESEEHPLRPTLSYTYTPSGTVSGNDASKHFTEDTKIEVNVISNDVDNQSADITNVTTFEWETCQEDGHEDIVHGFISTHAGTEESHEFWIHVPPYMTPDTVVIDFGLPVDIDVLANDALMVSDGELERVGIAAPEHMYPTLGSNQEVENGYVTTLQMSDSGGLRFGNATVLDGKVRYSLSNMKMDDVDSFYYAVNYSGGTGPAGYYYAQVTVIPATSIYYEDSFITFTNGTDGVANELTTGEWKQVTDSDEVGIDLVDKKTTASTATQNQDRPGFENISSIDANKIYGSDDAYTTCTKYSLGSAAKVTVSADNDTANNGAWPYASFTFTGTGFDVISLTSSTTGTILVDVEGTTASNKTVDEQWIVDTYYGYKIVDGKPVINTEAGDNALYQVPVIKSGKNLEYGTYTVTITVLYGGFEGRDKSSFDFYLDAIRIYDPAGTTFTDGNVVGDAYKEDKEATPGYFEVRNQLINGKSFDKEAENVSGAIFIDGYGEMSESTDGHIDKYTNYGPNNEVYLKSGQAIAFYLTATEKPESVHIAMKLANGPSVDAKVNNEDFEIATATDLYYDITDQVRWSLIPDDGVYKTKSPIIICNNAVESSETILSITNLKWAFGEADAESTQTVQMMVMPRQVYNMYRQLSEMLVDVNAEWDGEVEDSIPNEDVIPEDVVDVDTIVNATTDNTGATQNQRGDDDIVGTESPMEDDKKVHDISGILDSILDQTGLDYILHNEESLLVVGGILSLAVLCIVWYYTRNRKNTKNN